MNLDRKLQRKILQALQDVYPDSLLVSALPDFSNNRSYMGNLFYLQEHQLIEGGDIREPGQCRSMVDAQITRKGLDFLAEDGGLAAILGQLTVNIDHMEILDSIDTALSKSDMSFETKNELFNNLDKCDLKALLLHFFEEGIHSVKENLSATVRDLKPRS